MLRNRRVLFGLAVSAIFLVLLLWQIDLSEIGTALKNAEPGWILLATPVYLLGLWLRAWRWQLVLRSTLPISIGEAFAMMMVGFAANNLLPIRAGEVVRAGMLRQAHGVGWTIGFGTI
ncbi:MAG TPA: lysylphosphatidylglycerol synthase transmembrane domain-containing protein, partial [Dehalococcoidia bacterium]|nr:lysylphosphatidylglycerol synthase transmembrane domain-containing protein [Dehalococcoidia bacterium]